MQSEDRIRKPDSSNGKGARLYHFSQTLRRERLHLSGPPPQAKIYAGSLLLETRVQTPQEYDVDISVYFGSLDESVSDSPSNEKIKAHFVALTNELCQRYEGIGVNERVLGGMPHIKGLRVSVPNVLTHLYHLGSIDAVVAEFGQRISKEQIKEAIAYAHDFMEMACDPSEDDD